MRAFVFTVLLFTILAQVAVAFAPGAPSHIHEQLLSLSKVVKDVTDPLVGALGVKPAHALRSEAASVGDDDQDDDEDAEEDEDDNDVDVTPLSDVNANLAVALSRRMASRRAADTVVGAAKRFVVKRAQVPSSPAVAFTAFKVHTGDSARTIRIVANECSDASSFLSKPDPLAIEQAGTSTHRCGPRSIKAVLESESH